MGRISGELSVSVLSPDNVKQIECGSCSGQLNRSVRSRHSNISTGPRATVKRDLGDSSWLSNLDDFLHSRGSTGGSPPTKFSSSERLVG